MAATPAVAGARGGLSSPKLSDKRLRRTTRWRRGDRSWDLPGDRRQSGDRRGGGERLRCAGLLDLGQKTHHYKFEEVQGRRWLHNSSNYTMCICSFTKKKAAHSTHTLYSTPHSLSHCTLSSQPNIRHGPSSPLCSRWRRLPPGMARCRQYTRCAGISAADTRCTRTSWTKQKEMVPTKIKKEHIT